MCLILISYKQSSNFPLIIAANRDEYFARPTQTAHFWVDNPSILAGRDLVHGGSWLGVNKQGRIAAVTNFREPPGENVNVRSRGLLVSNFLKSDINPQDYLHDVSRNIDQFDAFNLLVGDRNSLYVLESVDRQISVLEQGVYGISNGVFDCPWPKVIEGKQRLAEMTNTSEHLDEAALFELLADGSTPPDGALPDTGVGLEWEQKLGSIFVKTETYGTRCSTLLSIDSNDQVSFVERNFENAGNEIEIARFNFELQ